MCDTLVQDTALRRMTQIMTSKSKIQNSKVSIPELLALEAIVAEKKKQTLFVCATRSWAPVAMTTLLSL